ncbi:MAG: response regulator [Oligoflexia bacterium]|nr:response regulator [Oligoflexia bacterium]
MKKILIADDALIIRVMLSDILAGGGHEVVGQAQNGIEAIAKYKELQPDLITLDIVMPEMDGIAALEEILKISPEAKIIMISAIDQKESLIKAIKLGARDYIIKPFENIRVLASVKKILEG